MVAKIENFPLILLAGGRSSRMGRPKGLLDYRGHPWLLEQLRRFKAVSGKLAVVVLGYHHELYFEKIPWLKKAGHKPTHQLGLKILAVVNPTPDYGQFSSIQCAIPFLQTKHLGSEEYLQGKKKVSAERRTTNDESIFSVADLPGAFILPVDVPSPGKEVYEGLIQAFSKTIDAVVPQYQSKGGHPVLLSAGFLKRLAEVSPASPDARLDLQIRALPVERIALVPVHDKNICLNINSFDEFQDYAKREDESGRT